MSTDLYDVSVLGAGPAGATAAVLLAQRDIKVALIDRERFPKSGSTAVWLNALAVTLLEELDVPVKPLLTKPFKSVTFYNADFTKSAHPNFKSSPGFLLDRVKLDNILVKKAASVGAKVITGTSVVRLKLRESSVLLELADGQSIESRLLVLATGRRGELVEQVGLGRGPSGPTVWCQHVEAESGGGSKASEPQIGVVMGLDRKGSFAIFWVTRDEVAITLNWYGDSSRAGQVFAQVCRDAYGKEILPVDLSDKAAAAALIRCPAATALDMDTHVGKHTLIIGDAGGFVSAASTEGFYPAMWSASIAAGVVQTALNSKHSQDALKSFDAEWRIKMADFLRAPNTDPQFLIPLVFSNQSMADRMGAAFFLGENI